MLKLIKTIAVLISLSSPPSFAASEWLHGMEMNSCKTNGDCLALKAESGQRAIYNDMYVIKNIVLTWHKADGTSSDDRKIYASRGFIDLDMNHLVIRGIKDQPFTEMVVSLGTHNSTEFN